MSGTNTSRRIRQAALELAARDGLTYQQAHNRITARTAPPPQSLWAAGIDSLFGPRLAEWQFLVAVSVDGAAYAQAWESPESREAYWPRAKYGYRSDGDGISAAIHARAGAEWMPSGADRQDVPWSWAQAHADAGVTWGQTQELIDDPDRRGPAYRGVFDAGAGCVVAVGPREICDLLADDEVWSGPAGHAARACAAALLAELFASLLLAVAVDYGATRSNVKVATRLAVPADVAGWPDWIVDDVGSELVVHVSVDGAPGPLVVAPSVLRGPATVYATTDVPWSGADRQLDPECAEVPVPGVSVIPARRPGLPLRLLAAKTAPDVPLQAELWQPWLAQLTDAQVWNDMAAERSRRDAWADTSVTSAVSVRTAEVPEDLADWWTQRAQRIDRPLLSVLLRTIEELGDAAATLGERRLPIQLGGAPVAVAVPGTAEQWAWLDARLATCVLLTPAEAFVEVLRVAYAWDPGDE